VRPLTARECATLDRIARGMTQKMIAFEFGISIDTVGNIAANAYKKLGVHSAAAAVLAHRDAHPWCGSRIDFGPILERIKASRTALEGAEQAASDAVLMIDRGAASDRATPRAISGHHSALPATLRVSARRPRARLHHAALLRSVRQAHQAAKTGGSPS